MTNTNIGNRKVGSEPSILHYFSKAAAQPPKRLKTSENSIIKSAFPAIGNDVNIAMTPLHSATAFNPHLPPSSCDTPASVISDESSSSPRGEVAVESTSLNNNWAVQSQQHHDTSDAPISNKHDATIDLPETPPTPPPSRDLGDIETPPSPDSQSSWTPPTPPTPQSGQQKMKNRKRRQCPQAMTMSTVRNNDEDEDTPQSLLDRHDGIHCDDDYDGEGYQLQRRNHDSIAATNTSVSRLSSKKFNSTKPFNKAMSYSNFKQSLKLPTANFKQQRRPLKGQQQQKQPTKKKKSSQLFLDFGQSSFGKRTLCNICGMLRVHGVAEDDTQHAKICKDYKEGVTCVGWKNERKLIEFDNRDNTASTRNSGGSSSSSSSTDRVVEVRDSDPLQHRRKVLEVKRIVDNELGFAISGRQCHDESNNSHVDEKEGDLLSGLTSYLYISKKRVVGLLLVKRIQRAYEVVVENDNNKKHYDPVSSSFSISRSLKSTRALLGIHQIWVHSSHRKKGIASKLVNAARDHLIFGMIIPVELIAFSSPTDEGLQFAKRYVGLERPLVYDI